MYFASAPTKTTVGAVPAGRGFPRRRGDRSDVERRRPNIPYPTKLSQSEGQLDYSREGARPMSRFTY